MPWCVWVTLGVCSVVGCTIQFTCEGTCEVIRVCSPISAWTGAAVVFAAAQHSTAQQSSCTVVTACVSACRLPATACRDAATLDATGDWR